MDNDKEEKMTQEAFRNSKEGITRLQFMNMQHQLILVNERWDRVKPPEGGEVDNKEVDRMLFIMSAAIRLDVQLLPELQEHLADALRAIACREDPVKVLGYRFERGDSASAIEQAVTRIHGLLVELTKEAEGLNKTDARKKVAHELKVPKSTIARHHRAYLKLLEDET